MIEIKEDHQNSPRESVQDHVVAPDHIGGDDIIVEVVQEIEADQKEGIEQELIHLVSVFIIYTLDLNEGGKYFQALAERRQRKHYDYKKCK